MRLSHLACFLVVLLGLGCARPSLEDAGDASTMGDEDLEPDRGDGDVGDDEQPAQGVLKRDAAVPPPVDTSTPQPPVDAGASEPAPRCEDTDGDEVCDADDNCPSDQNRDQRDSDNDGTGDACEELVGPTVCNGIEVPTDVRIDNAQIQWLEINGATRRSVTVKPGELVHFRVSLRLGGCGTAGGLPGLSIALEGGRSQCQRGSYCPPVVSFSLFEIELPAPREPGIHYLLAGIGDQGLECSEEIKPQTRIAALCVEG